MDHYWTVTIEVHVRERECAQKKEIHSFFYYLYFVIWISKIILPTSASILPLLRFYISALALHLRFICSRKFLMSSCQQASCKVKAGLIWLTLYIFRKLVLQWLLAWWSNKSDMEQYFCLWKLVHCIKDCELSCHTKGHNNFHLFWKQVISLQIYRFFSQPINLVYVHQNNWFFTTRLIGSVISSCRLPV